MISAVVLTKNEENNIKECLHSLSFCDEVLVIDDNSADKTRDISKKMGAKIYIRDIDRDFSAQSNFGMEKATGDWIFFVDADERVSKELAREITKSISKDININGYYIKRTDFIWGRKLKYGESGNIKLMRLIRKGSGDWKRRVHPYFDIEGKTSYLKNPLFHFPHQSIFSFIRSLDRWSTWHALANEEEGKRSSLIKIVFWPVLHFMKNYIIRLGFLDGIEGFIFAAVMSFHSFLSWSKLFLRQSMLRKLG